jgi:hypothetical protein
MSTALPRASTPRLPDQPRPSGAQWNSRARLFGLFAFVILLTFALYAFAPDDVGSDYELFQIVSLKALAGEPIYQAITRSDGFVVRFLYPPHVAFGLTPLAVLPFRVAWAIVCGLATLIVLLVGCRWEFDFLKLILSLTVLPAVFSLYQGNIDGLLLVTLLIPLKWQMGFILVKPQSIGGLGLRTLKHKEAWFVLIAIALAAIIFRFQDAIIFANQASSLTNVNLWHKATPYQFVPGVLLLWLGMRRNDQRILLLCSPFLSPYATLGSLWPAWIGMSAIANRWVLLLLWAGLWVGAGFGLLTILL